MITDVLIYESGGGGEILIRGNDVATVSGYENAPYLALFGGGDWWGNHLCPGNEFLAKTEAILKITPLTSSGRIAIENAIKSDLSFLSNIPGTTWNVSTAVVSPSRLDMVITINGKEFNYLWNPDLMFLKYQV